MLGIIWELSCRLPTLLDEFEDTLQLLDLLLNLRPSGWQQKPGQPVVVAVVFAMDHNDISHRRVLSHRTCVVVHHGAGWIDPRVSLASANDCSAKVGRLIDVCSGPVRKGHQRGIGLAAENRGVAAGRVVPPHPT